MRGDLANERSAAARPVADAPVAALVARADELARRWAAALILTRPLSEMPALALEDLSREAPALCAQLARALDSDRQLEQMLAQDDSRTGTSPTLLRALVASSDSSSEASSLVDAVEALRGVCWDAMLCELYEPSARQVGDLANRLAYVCAQLLSAALAGERPAVSAEPIGGTLATTRGRVLYSSPRSSSGGRAAVLIDERDDLTPAPTPPAVAPRARETVGAASSASAERTTPPGERVAWRAEHTRYAERERTTFPQGASRPEGRPRPWDTPLNVGRPAPRAREERAAPPHEPPDRPDAVMRVTRGPMSPREQRGRG